jgi:hypothetical protein
MNLPLPCLTYQTQARLYKYRYRHPPLIVEELSFVASAVGIYFNASACGLTVHPISFVLEALASSKSGSVGSGSAGTSRRERERENLGT